MTARHNSDAPVAIPDQGTVVIGGLTVITYACQVTAVRTHPEYLAMLENLTATQARCTELIQELRALKRVGQRVASQQPAVVATSQMQADDWAEFYAAVNRE